ncbi:ICMT-domain-containing protein [Dichomitus squalens LYAD-421 SS1]|uniref:Protein-S-isoprenylcysteine O-methyltransferase n=1 Tax=Dichomitus squalens (strain LYAD-421) TaxID=732165 RepID=R7ST28_DICSQ|nr:ICMT-domain-containing protein [Dichomitus squalens LYAD-421 SS1]EJF58132.1 ICMT-domain-containing protein [Dichomitus squalens LYAD-421 SS1]
MISLAPFVSTTPLLKVPLLVTNSMLTYYGMTPPRQPPPTKEQLRFTVPDLMTRTTRIQMAATAASKTILCSITLIEATVVLARQFPSPFSDHILSYFFPARRSSSSLQLTPISAVACALGISGGLIRVWCHRELGRFFTWEVAVRDNHQLITSGPYSIVRHPGYTGWLLLIAGNFALLASGGSYFREAGLWKTITGRAVAGSIIGYLSWVTVNLLKRTAEEDAILEKEFGVQWEDWARKTPHRLIPLIY